LIAGSNKPIAVSNPAAGSKTRRMEILQREGG
jgi:hypothetical protein